MAKRAKKVVTPLVPAKRKLTPTSEKRVQEFFDSMEVKPKRAYVRKPKALPMVINPATPTKVSVHLPYKLVEELTKFSAARGVTLDEIIRVTAQGIMKRSNFYDLNTEFKFGKYTGETTETIIRMDPSYIEYMLGVRAGMTLSPEATDLLEEMLNVE